MFWEDYYAQNPLEVHRNEDGQIQFSNTGDDLIDKWEEQLAEGKTPNYLEGFTEEQLASLERLRTRGTDQFGRTIRDTVEAIQPARPMVPPSQRFRDVEE